MRSRLRAVCLAFALLAGAPDSWAQSVWVVDKAGGAGSQFTNIQGAIDAAADRDIVLVKSGAYGSFTINGKGLVIVGDTNAEITFPVSASEPSGPTATITGTAPWQPVVLRGLGEVVSFPVSSLSLSASGCAGPVWIEDCAFHARDEADDIRLPICEAGSVDTLRPHPADTGSIVGSIWK